MCVFSFWHVLQCQFRPVHVVTACFYRMRFIRLTFIFVQDYLPLYCCGCCKDAGGCCACGQPCCCRYSDPVPVSLYAGSCWLSAPEFTTCEGICWFTFICWCCCCRLLYVEITETGSFPPNSLLSFTADRVGSAGGACVVPVTLSSRVLPFNETIKSVSVNWVHINTRFSITSIHIF